MVSASRALTRTLVSKLRPLALATPFSITCSNWVSAFLNTSWLIAYIEIFMDSSLLDTLVKQCAHLISLWCAHE